MNYNNEILRLISDYIDEGIHIIDKEGNTLIYNKGMESLEGLNGNEVIGKKLLEVFPSLNETTSTLLRVVKTGESIFERYQSYVNKRGYNITAVNTTVPVVIDGEIVGAIEISKDFTKIKELYDRIINLSGKAEKGTERSPMGFSNIIGYSPKFLKAIQAAKKASASSSTVLIYGETGTGKEVFSKSIHYDGIRSDKPFVAVNCAALPDGLLEGILFGTVKGGFTGAINRPGLFEQAHGGTLLLDEINSMSLTLQAKLLRVLQESNVRRIGDVKDIPIDVRIIATTNEDPYNAILKGILRKDLFYRLSVINLTISPLRERKEDIALLVKEFINRYNLEFTKEVWDVQDEVYDALMSYEWPGNVRELKNYIEGAMNMVSGHILKKEHFTPQVQELLFEEGVQPVFNFEGGYNYEASLDEYIEDMEKKIIMKALMENNYNISETSRVLKIKRQTLQHKMKKYNINS